MDHTSQTRRADLVGRYPKWSALLFGLLTATGFPPLHAWPVALVAMGGFVWLLYRASSWKRAFVLGWLFGVAHFTLTNNWIATAFTYQAEMPAILGWAAVPLLSLYLAVWPGLAALAAKLVVRVAEWWHSRWRSARCGSRQNGCAVGSSPAMHGVRFHWPGWADGAARDWLRCCHLAALMPFLELWSA